MSRFFGVRALGETGWRPLWRGGTSEASACLSGVLHGLPAAAREKSTSGEKGRSEQAAEVTQSAERREFDRIVAEYQNRIYNVIYRLINDEEEAFDLTQDTFVNAYRAFRRFRGEASIYTWLYRIAVNRTKNRLKQRGRQQAMEVASLDEPMGVGEDTVDREIEDWSNSPGRRLENQELGELIDAWVAGLPADFREVVILRDYEGLSYKEIADIVGCSMKAIKSRLFRARSVLREKLRGYLGPDGE